MLAFSEELRAMLRGNLGGVLFLDAGNVWAESWSINLSDLRYAVGPGLRYQTPVGPLRLDFGYQLNPIPGLLVNGEPQSRRWRLHFSMAGILCLGSKVWGSGSFRGSGLSTMRIYKRLAHVLIVVLTIVSARRRPQ
jgi:hypothetical protein